MKKILLSTALLSASAGMAAAEVTFSGYGRFGLEYVEGRDQETQVAMRLRFNINLNHETDSGVTFGGRIRIQYQDGQTDSNPSAGYAYASYEGFRLEVGNANTAYDSVELMYNSEMGYLNTSFGNPLGDFYAFESRPYSTAEKDRMGIFAAYSVGDLNIRASYVTPNQTTDLDIDEEMGISVDYKFGAVTLAAAYAQDAAGIADNDLTFVGAEYAFNDAGNVGLLYFNDDLADQSLVTLYGNYKFDAITARAYVGFGDEVGTEDTSYGIGADYDLGGARLSGSIQQDFYGDMFADVGVRFDF